jgi:hypothetical protein
MNGIEGGPGQPNQSDRLSSGESLSLSDKESSVLEELDDSHRHSKKKLRRQKTVKKEALKGLSLDTSAATAAEDISAAKLDKKELAEARAAYPSFSSIKASGRMATLEAAVDDIIMNPPERSSERLETEFGEKITQVRSAIDLAANNLVNKRGVGA